ncbi:hypothetical protein [Glycomyces sp. NPDC047010]|uniref:hypothetical protein n=1 Tax=Glycomyces sp. NPDC047010 TaxID=3155023 RepID=UPI0033C4A95C
MPETSRYTQDTEAIRDVANSDFAAIADDLAEARRVFIASCIDTAGFFEDPPGPELYSLRCKWAEAGEAIARGMALSVERIEDAAASLRQTADDYDDADDQAAADLDGINGLADAPQSGGGF